MVRPIPLDNSLKAWFEWVKLLQNRTFMGFLRNNLFNTGTGFSQSVYWRGKMVPALILQIAFDRSFYISEEGGT